MSVEMEGPGEHCFSLNSVVWRSEMPVNAAGVSPTVFCVGLRANMPWRLGWMDPLAFLPTLPPTAPTSPLNEVEQTFKERWLEGELSY